MLTNKLELSTSLASRRESNIIKGILIILIIIGHNGILMGKLPGERPILLNSFLYSFHVYCFLLLPFIYNIPQLSVYRVKKNFLHLYKSYTFFFIILLIISHLPNFNIDFISILYAYITGSEPLLKQNIGASFLWFIPSMFTLLFFRDWLLHKNDILPFCITISIIMHLLCYTFAIIPFYSYSNYFIGGSLTAITYFGMACITRVLIKNKLFENKKNQKITIIVGVIACIAFFILHNLNIRTIAVNFFDRSVLPIIMFSFIYSTSCLFQSKKIMNIFENLGKISLEIYLIHIFIYNILQLFFQKIGYDLNLFIGFIILICTILITIFSIYIIKKINPLHNFLFK